MAISNYLNIRLISVVLVCGTVGLLLPQIQAHEGQVVAKVPPALIKKLENPFPSCGPGRKVQRFVIIDKAEGEVCDSKTGLQWERSPNSEHQNWVVAMAHCTNLTLNGKKWRLANVMEYVSLLDYRMPNQADSLNAALFVNVQPDWYWSGTVDAQHPQIYAWRVRFQNGSVTTIDQDDIHPRAWCVSGPSIAGLP